jgi:Ca2+-binding RTX toxin-like protein
LITTSVSIENAIGSAFNDQIYGDGGANVLEGGAGADSIFGVGGDDIYVFHAGFGKDDIFTFVTGGTEDAIQFDSTLFPTFAAVMAATQDQGGNAVITLDPNNTITLHDVVKANLTAGDFHFV